MSRAQSQLHTFEILWDELRPRIAADRNLPERIQQRLAKEKRFGSRDRRLYRELLYTAIRYHPWLEKIAQPQTPSSKAQTLNAKFKTSASVTTLWLAADSPATALLKQELLADAPPCPATITERAALLDQRPDALLPVWLREHCPLAFEEPNITALHTRAPLWMRLQTNDPTPVFSEFTARGWTWRSSEILPGALELHAHNDPDLTQTESYQRGLIEIQDLGSQLILPTALKSLGPASLQSLKSPPARWLDACAGAGGKTLQLARLLGPSAQIDATDPRPASLAELATRASRAGLKNIRVLRQSPLAPANPHSAIQTPSFYDAVVVDAPCSGTGTWRRSPHLKYCTTEAAVLAAAKLQLDILTRHAPLVRKNGGMLIYATCSLSRRENEDVILAFLSLPEHSDFKLELQTAILPAAHNTDGFFVATLKHTGLS